MNSLWRPGVGQKRYYLGPAGGIEDCHLGRSEVPGPWLGAGIRAVGLDGEVTAEAPSAVPAWL